MTPIKYKEEQLVKGGSRMSAIAWLVVIGLGVTGLPAFFVLYGLLNISKLGVPYGQDAEYQEYLQRSGETLQPKRGEAVRLRILIVLVVVFFQGAPGLWAQQPGNRMTPELAGYLVEVGSSHLIIMNGTGILALPRISNLDQFQLFLAYAISHDQPIRFLAKIVPDHDQSDFHMEIVNPRLVSAKLARD